MVDEGQANAEPIWRVPLVFDRVRPDAVALLEEASAAAWRAMDPTTLELVRLRIATLLGHDTGLKRRSGAAREHGLTEQKIIELPDYYRSSAFSKLELDVLEFVEQFVIDVSALTASEGALLRPHYGPFDDQLLEIVTAIYLTECVQRLEIIGPRLFDDTVVADPESNALVGPPEEGPRTLKAVLGWYQDAVMRGRELDPVLTELVRLRCARTHNCRICQALRSMDAVTAGVDESLAAKIDFYERSDLDERYKVALRITDAFITRPDSLGADTAAKAREMFSVAQLVEICLDITKWSTQKIKVSLGLDGTDRITTNDEGLAFFRFGVDGQPAGFSAARPAAAAAGHR